MVGTTRTNWSIQTRFHVFDAKSGNLLWQSNTNYGWSAEVHLAPDPDYVVCVNRYFSTQYLNRRRRADVMGSGRLVKTEIGTELMESWLTNTWAVRIYRREKLLRSHSLKDLDAHPMSMKFSASHAEFARTRLYHPRWQEDPNYDPFGSRQPTNPSDPPALTDRIYANPSFANGHILLNCLDCKTRVFDLKTGELLETIGEEAAEIRYRWRSYAN